MPDVFGMNAADRLKLAKELTTELRSGMNDTHDRPGWSKQNFQLLDHFAVQHLKADTFYARTYRAEEATPEELRRKEFLWDFVAFIEGKGIIFAAESEWIAGEKKIGDVLGDFEKLFYARAPVKLMLCRLYEKAEPELFVEKLKSDLQSYLKKTCSAFEAGEVVVLYVRGWTVESGASNDVAYLMQIPGEVPAAPQMSNVEFTKL